MSEISKSKKMTFGVIGTLLAGAVAFGAWSWYSNRNIGKVSKLVDRLAVAGDLPKAERNALKLELMRTVDELPGDKLQKLYKQLGEKGKEYEKEKIVKFAAASDADKPALLDADLERYKNRGEVWRSLRSDGMPYSSWGGKRRGRRGKGKGDNKGEKKELSEEEKSARAEFRKQQGEYYTALKARARELGMGKGERGGKGRRGK